MVRTSKKRKRVSSKKWKLLNRTTGVCSQTRTVRVPYHNKADGFMAALVLVLNQVKFCELHGCQPAIEWGPFPACKYEGVRYPGHTPFFEANRGSNAFLYFFKPLCNSQAQLGAPSLSCEQREQIHRALPWAVRTYYYGTSLVSDPANGSLNGSSVHYDEAWYGVQRSEGARLASSYLRLQVTQL